MAITPLRESSSQTNPMRRIFSSRSSLLKPRPLERYVRTTSPSSTSTLAPQSRNLCSRSFAVVLLPAPDIPVSHTVNPRTSQGYEKYDDGIQKSEFRRQNSCRRSRAAHVQSNLDRDHDFANLLVRFQILISFHRLRQRECFGDLGMKPPVGQPIEDVLFRSLEKLRILADFRHRVAANRESFPQRDHGERRRLHGKPAVFENDSLEGRRLAQFLDARPSH